MTNRSQISLIMVPISPELPELFALDLGKIAAFDLVYTSTYKGKPISTKFGQNVYDHNISVECGYG